MVELHGAGRSFNEVGNATGIEVAMSRSVPFVFLASMPYSGSTLFSILVNSHPQIATVGEMTGPKWSVNPETYLCSCGQRIKDCAFWQEVAKGMASRGFCFDPGHFDTSIEVGGFRPLRRALTGSLGNSVLEDIRDGLLCLWPSRRERLREVVHEPRRWHQSSSR